jgi:sugar (pentulose or hexulose) kinase
MVTNALDEPVEVSPVPEASLRGAAMLAWERFGHAADSIDTPPGPVRLPERQGAEAFRRLATRQAALEAALSECVA